MSTIWVNQFVDCQSARVSDSAFVRLLGVHVIASYIAKI